jgi:hypothetical protein
MNEREYRDSVTFLAGVRASMAEAERLLAEQRAIAADARNPGRDAAAAELPSLLRNVETLRRLLASAAEEVRRTQARLTR